MWRVRKGQQEIDVSGDSQDPVNMSSVASSESADAVDEDTNEKLEWDTWEGQFSLSEGDPASMTNSVSSTVTLTASGTAADLMMDPKAVKNAKNQQKM